MKNKELDIVKTIRSIRDKNYEETKELSRKELLERYKKRGKEAIKKSVDHPRAQNVLNNSLHPLMKILGL